MPDFNNIRQQLNEARNEKNQAQQDHFISKEKLKKVKAEKEKLERSLNPEDQAQVAKLQQLSEQEAGLITTIEKFKSELNGRKGIESELFESFRPFTDPREQIGNMNDAFPFLLMPVRMETRFKKVESAGEGTTDQLWIRIFPDDCAVDSFEKILSETEVKNVQYYWRKMWEAGGIEEEQRAAWRILVSSHGSGRAAYIISEYEPINKGDIPTKAIGDIILTIGAEELPDATEQEALKAYWEIMWVNFGDTVAGQQAHDDLVSEVGLSRAEELVEQYVPSNFTVKPAAPSGREDVTVDVVFLQWKKSDEVDTKQQSWSQAPHVDVMPDRFVVIGYDNGKKVFEVIGNQIPSPLIVGPDPNAEPGEQFTENDGEIEVGGDIKWMVDFDEAIQKGLGMKINISSTQATRGFDRIVALGIRMSADESKGQEMLETLFDHYQKSRKGLSLLNQGTPTNNTDTEGSGYEGLDDPDVSFENIKKEKLFEAESDWYLRKDGQWLADSLGIEYEFLQKVTNSGHTDQCEGRIMNVALWPATMGYMMESLMQPVFKDSDITQTREFFNQFVSGRGMVPALQIGKQPYGILPTTAFSKIKWFRGRTIPGATNHPGQKGSFLQQLYSILAQIDTDWEQLLENVAHVGQKEGDAHQILLDAIALNPSSVEFYQRNAESVEELFNRYNLMGFGGTFYAWVISAAYVHSGVNLLSKFGHQSEELPDILNKLFLQSQNLLKGPLVDDRPLSEEEPIRIYTTDDKNYLEWLIAAAETSHDTLRQQKGFIDNKIPSSLLYLMLHHALDLNFTEVSMKLFNRAGILSDTAYRQAKVEPAFLHIKQETATTESPWQYLYSKDTRITGVDNLTVGEYIPQIITTDVATAYLHEQLKALDHLKNVPTARLERAFSEHIDCCSYRLDAWKSGIINYQLANMRQLDNTDQQERRKGTYIGAYCWLENVKSENKTLTPVALEETELHDIFIKDQEIPLVKDDTNGGHIAAPSLNHAVTAAILRNGYMSNDDPEIFKVNLSSERVRKALAFIQGIRGGQSLGALLGYQLERGLHEGYPGTELDYFIHQLRKAFPLVANRNKDTEIDETSEQPIDAVEEIEARNVIDGLSLLEHISKTGNNTYPFGKTWLPPLDNNDQETAISKEIDKIKDINDAVADLAMAESVHQIVQGNYDRGVANLDGYSKGAFPPIPDVVQTPRSGTTITHRVGLHLETGLNPALMATPRAQAEPAVNKWLATVMPAMSDIICQVSYGSITDEAVTAAMLGLEPIDLMYLLNTESDQAMTEIDDRIVKLVLDKPNVRPDTEVSINYMKKAANEITMFEMAPLCASLRSIVLRSRPLEMNDAVLSGDAKVEENANLHLNKDRIQLRYNTLNSLLISEISSYNTTIDALVVDIEANRAAIITQADALMDDFTDILFEIGRSGLPQAGLGFIYDHKKVFFKGLLEKLEEVIARWDKKLTEFDAIMADYASLGNDTAKLDLLEKARRKISTLIIPVPADMDDYKTDIEGLRADMVAKQADLQSLANTSTKLISSFIAAIKALDIADFDVIPIEVTDIEDQIILFVQDLERKSNELTADLEKRLTSALQLRTDSDNAETSKKTVNFLLDAAKQLFHEDFKVVPEFGLVEEKATEWENAFNDKNQLLSHIGSKVDFPVDEWLYGVSRVREKMHHWENMMMLTEAFDQSEPLLHPIQLPYKATDSWLALEYPEDYAIDSDRLLYTAHYATPFDRTKRQCGLLIDEWTEVIPSREETVGVTFHYDRPNAEPPQSMLLALPTEFKGAWSWDDLVDVVNETFDMAKKRAIEPSHVDTTDYARFLPAVISSMMTYPFSPSLNFSFNNKVYDVLPLNQNP